MADFNMTNVLEQSNEQLITSLNGQNYIQPPPSTLNSPLYQTAMGSSRPGDPFALERIAAEGRASRAFSEAMARQSEQEAMHAAIGTALMAVPGVGVGLSMLYDPVSRALGLREPERLYSQADYVKSNMAASLANSMVGQMGGNFVGGSMSIQQANAMSDDVYGFMRQQGFQGLELGRIMPMLGSSGLMASGGGFASAEDALSQFQVKLEGFLEKITSTVRNASVDIETATAMAISESMLSGSRSAVPGSSYVDAARSISGMTGSTVGAADQAMRMSLGSWGTSIYDRTNMAESLAFNVAGAITASQAGGRYDAAWIGADAGQVGVNFATAGNQYWATHQNDLARLWSDGAMPGGAAWDSIVAGDGIPKGIGSYGSIGNLNSRLEAQFYGMEAAAENPAQMMTGAMGMQVREMERKGITTRPAQIMYLMQQGQTQAGATQFMSVYDQMSSQEGRAISLFEGDRTTQSTGIQGVKTDLANLISILPQISQSNDADANRLVAAATFDAARNGGDMLPYITAQALLEGDQAGMGGILDILRPGSDKETNLSTLYSGLAGTMARNGMLGAVSPSDIIVGTIGNSDRQIEYLRAMNINRDMAGDYNVYQVVRNQALAAGYGEPNGTITEAGVQRFIADRGGAEGIRIEGKPISDYLMGNGGSVELTSRSVATDFFGEFSENVGTALDATYQDNYSTQRVITSRFSAGPAEADLLSRMSTRGYFSGVQGMTGLDDYRTATGNYDATRYLGAVTESSQGYRGSGAYGEQYQTLLNSLSEKGFSYNQAIAGLRPTTATAQIEARDRMAQAGYGKSYDDLTQMERNYIEEVFHANDSTGRAGERDWAGRHDNLIVGARGAAYEATAGVAFGGGERTLSLMSQAAEARGSTVADIEAYSAWSSAIQTDASAETVAFYRDKITNFDAASRAFADTSTRLGGGTAAQGEIMAAQAQAAFASGAGKNVTGEQLNTLWNAYRDDGSFSGNDITEEIRNALGDSDLGKLISGELSTEDFFKKQGEDVPVWSQNEEGSRSLSNVPEFQDAIKAIITPAGGVMPVMIADGSVLRGYLQFNKNNQGNNEGVTNTDSDTSTATA